MSTAQPNKLGRPNLRRRHELPP